MKFWRGSVLLIYNERTFSCSRLPIKFTKLLKIFLEGVRLRHSVLLVYNERAFSVIVFPSDSPNFRIYFWKGEHFEGSQLLVYNGRTFSPAKTPRQVQWYEVKRVIHENIRRKRHKWGVGMAKRQHLPKPCSKEFWNRGLDVRAASSVLNLSLIHI